MALLVCVGLLVGAGGCVRGDGASATKDRSTFVFAGAGDPKNFDPIFNYEGESLRVVRQVFDTLVQNKPGTVELEPALAERWEHDPTGTVWTFHLRRNVKFQDGTPFNAAAVCFNFDRWYSMRGAAAQGVMTYYADVFEGFQHNDIKDLGESLYRGCRAPDDATAVITLARYKSAFPAAFTVSSFAISSPTALKKYDADKVTQVGDAFEYSDYANLHPTGTGPFRFGGWDKATDQITLLRNDDYWGPKAKVAKVVIKVVKDETARRQELEAGAVDAIDSPAPADRKVLADDGFKVLVRPAFNILYLGINQKADPKLADLRVRQAIAYAVNRVQLVKSQGPSGAAVAKEFQPRAVEGYADDVMEYPYDPAKARSLLREAGAEHLTLEFDYPSDVSRPYMPSPTDIYQALARDLEAVGFTIKGVPLPWNGGYVQQLGKPALHLLGWTGDYNDPGNFNGVLFGRAKSSFGDQDMTAMFEAVAKVSSEADDTRRTALWKQVNRDIMSTWLPAVPIWHAPPAIVTSKNITGLVASPAADERFAGVEKKG